MAIKERSVIFRFIKKDINKAGGQSSKNQMGIPCQIEDCEKMIKSLFCNSFDVVVEPFDTEKEKAMIVFIDGLVDKDLIDRDVIKPLKSLDFNGDLKIAFKTVYSESQDIAQVVKCILAGFSAVFYTGERKAYLFELKQWSQRAVDEPDAESVIRGPKEGFTENIRTNTSLIRRKLKNQRLVIENKIIGRQTSTPVEILYIDGIVNRRILDEIKKRLDSIDTDLILETGEIEQYICENSFSPLSGIGLTQKPDVVAGKIVEGRIAILVDGTPHVLTVPELFIENFHTAEDYYNRPLYATFIRLLRFVALFITVLFPGLSIAILTFHHEMVPDVFLSSVISASLKTPMPLMAEVFLLTLMFELLREAGTRMPKAVGSAITIVGSLIIGEAAVNAAIVSEAMVIVVALTAVTSFMLPNLLEFSIIYRTLFWILGGTMGLIGIGMGIMVMLTQLASTDAFGVPILSSFSRQELKDSFIRVQLKNMIFRPVSIVKDNRRRRG